MGSAGGDSLTQDLNVSFDRGDMAWVATAGCLVAIMVPGIGFFYAGLSRKKHSLSLIWTSMACWCLVTFQWFFWGWSFVFSHEAGSFWGKIDNFSFINVLAEPAGAAPAVPDILFAFFQGQFACVAAILMLGGAHERVRLGPMLVFLFIWTTVVYDPLAEETWNPNGWLAKLGALDFAGGGPVHMSSGVGSLAYALWVGKRHDPVATDKIIAYKPGSVFLVVLGTVFLWFGWFGFNGGSTGNASIRSWYALVNTNLAAAFAGLVYMLCEYVKTRKWSTVGICSGVVAGLVGITPAAGFVPVYTSIAIGGITAIACFFATYLKHFLRIDDGLDVFALHGVGGAVGSILTGLFAADYVSHLDGSTIAQGWMNHHYVQLPYQLAAIGMMYGWTFVWTSFILLCMNYFPGGYLRLRLSEEDEALGTDRTQLAEYGIMYEESDGLFALGTVTRNQQPYPDAYQYRPKPSTPPDNSTMENSDARASSPSRATSVSGVTAGDEPKPVAA